MTNKQWIITILGFGIIFYVGLVRQKSINNKWLHFVVGTRQPAEDGTKTTTSVPEANRQQSEQAAPQPLTAAEITQIFAMSGVEETYDPVECARQVPRGRVQHYDEYIREYTTSDFCTAPSAQGLSVGGKHVDRCPLDAVRFKRHHFKVGMGDNCSFGTQMHMEYIVDNPRQLEDFVFVQFVRGCMFNGPVSMDAVFIRDYAVRDHMGQAKDFNFREWAVDTVDSDPAYYTEPGRARHANYRYSADGTFDRERSARYEDITDRSRVNRLFVRDTPTLFTMNQESAGNRAVEFKMCLYWTQDVPVDIRTDEARQRLQSATPIVCENWQSLWTYNPLTSRVYKGGDVNLICHYTPTQE